MLKQNPKVEEPYEGDPLVRVCEGDRMKVLSLLGAWSTKLEAQRHREYPTYARNVAGIPLPGVPASIIPATPLGVIQRERGEDGIIWMSPSTGCFPLQETVAFILSTCTRVEKLMPHLYFSARWNYLRASASLAVLGGW
jgi:hypothetical protein